MNYYKQVAEMLGLELGQEFILTDSYGKRKDEYTYQITKNGFLYKSQINDDWYGERSETIERLLEGYDKAVPKPWKPKYGDAYWKWATNLEVTQFKRWNDASVDFAYWKLGNCFKTSEEAQSKGKEIMEQIMKEYKEA